MRSVLLFLLLLGRALAADEALTVDPRELPHFPPVEPQDAAATFQIKTGFHLELVAAEPQVASPIAVSFDENGRMFVCEMRDYSEQREEHPHLGRIRLLEDHDGDGRFEDAKIFADDLPWPTAVIWANGGVFVCATPDIWWLKDTDGDGRADVREIVFTGFHTGSPKLNVQGLPNNFAWGPDNRIHLQTGGGCRGLIRCPQRPELVPVEIGARDFWFDPRTFDFDFEAGGGQYGMSYDDAGRRFVCNNSDHLRTYLFDTRYAARNPFVSLPSPLASVAADGPAAEVFRISPDEPWRVVRTRWRASGRVPGVVEGGGRVSGYFTGATGTTVYRGDAYGPAFVGNTFTGDAGGNLAHRKVIRPEGVSVIGERPPDERTAEFLASRDTWFRPVNFANAPDGCLYVIDMYREVIEHPWSIPEPIKQHLDLTSGRDRGRIWRIAPDGWKPRPLALPGAMTTGQLVATLAHPNGWHRDTATRLIWERIDVTTAPPLLEKMVAESKLPLARLHALRALDGLVATSAPTLLRALNDEDERVREYAVRLCEKVALLPDEIGKKLRALEADPAPRVRLQLAFTLGEFTNDRGGRALAELAKRDAQDRWISAAILSAAPEQMFPLFQALASDGLFFSNDTNTPFLAQLATAIGARQQRAETEAVFARASNPPAQPTLLAALGDGLRHSGKTLADAGRPSLLPALFTAARSTLADAKASEFDRRAAAHLLAFNPAPESQNALLAALSPNTPPTLTRTIFDALDHAPDDQTATGLLGKWTALDAPLRAEAVRFLTAKPRRAIVLIEAIEGNVVAREAVPETVAAPLRKSRDAKLAAAATKLFPPPVVESRDALIARFMPALQLAGDAAKGHAIYEQRCMICHRFRGEGTAFGPDLESVVTGGREKLLTHIFDPNREVAPQFAAYTAELKDGTTLSGVLAAETPDSIRLREPLARETDIPRTGLARLQTTGKSPMPEGLEAGLQPQDLADLLTFLTGAK